MKAKKIEIFLEEGRKHMYFLREEIKNMQQRVNSIDFSKIDDVIMSDAFLFRFIKLQSLLTEKLFPYLYEFLTGKDRREATFIDILNVMERYKIISDIGEWQKIREIRNIFVHDYPGDDEIKKEALKKTITIVEEFFEVLEKIRVILEKNDEK